MRIIKTAAAAVYFEGRLWVAACSLRGSLPAAGMLLTSVLYLLGPVDFIPARVPYFGHVDEVGITTGSILGARLLLPPEAFLNVIGDASDGSSPLVPSALQLMTWLIMRRRLVRVRDHSRGLFRRLHSRNAGAPYGGNAGGRVFALLGYRKWWQLRSGLSRPRSETDGLIVVGGAPRSGTTLLRTMLGRHPMIATCPESTVFLSRISAPEDIATRLGWDASEIRDWQRKSRSQVEFIERFHEAILTRTGKAVWLEKTPRNIGRFRFVRSHFPRAKLIHIIRDGRDVVCSLRRTPFARLDHAAPDSPKAAMRCAVQWRKLVEAGTRLRHYSNYYELRYEDLVRDPEQQMRSLLSFVGLPWDPAILRSDPREKPDEYEARATDAIFSSSPGRWQRDLSAIDKRVLAALIGPTLTRLGYS
jgi:protein-tyrosine sulfotransferase